MKDINTLPEPQNEYLPTPITAFQIKQPSGVVFVHEGRFKGVAIRQDNDEILITRDSAVRLASALTQIVASLDARKEVSS